MELTIIVALFTVILVWGIFIFITDSRKDRKILDKYLANKHKLKTGLKRSALPGKAAASLTKESG